MRFGYWLPVFGGWLRNVPDEHMSASWDYVRRLAQRSEALGYDLTLVAELNLNDIKGADAPSLDAWSTASALAARAHVGDLCRHALGRIAVHEVGVARARDQLFRRLRFPSRVERRPRLCPRLGLERRALHVIEAARIAEARLGPHPVHHAQPLRRSSVTLVVLVEVDTVLARFVSPPR